MGSPAKRLNTIAEPAPERVLPLMPGAAEAGPWLWVSTDPVMPPCLQALSVGGLSLTHADPESLEEQGGAIIADGDDAVLVSRLLDWPREDGAPLLFVGALSSEERALLIEAEADDALHQSIDPAELLARMTAARRRGEWRVGRLRFGPLTLDTGLRQARWHQRAIVLMPREFDILLYLLRAQGRAVTRDAIRRAVWQVDHDPGTNSVDVHVCRLRRQLRMLGDGPVIETVKGIGYRLRLGQIANEAA